MTYLKYWQKKSCHPKLLYSTKISFKNEGEIKTFPDKQTLREFVTGRPVLQEMLMIVIQDEIKEH